MKYLKQRKNLFLTNQKREDSGLLLFFLFGFFIGVIWVNIKAEYFLEDSMFFGEDLLARLSYTSFHNKQYFIFLLQRRISVLVFLLLASTTAIGLIVNYGFIIWSGFGLGILLGSVTLRFGVKGILIFIASLIPQVFVYVPAFLSLLNIMRVLCMLLYYPAKLERQSGFEGFMQRSNSQKKQKLLKLAFFIFVLIGVVIIGILIESYVNPYILKKVIKVF